MVPESGASGVIITQGGAVGGWTLYAHQGHLKYCYNLFGIEHYMITADIPLPAGRHQVRMEFAYDGGGLGLGGDVTLYYDGAAVGKGRVEKTQPLAYSADEGCDVGTDAGSPASPDYGPTGNKFTGEIEWVQIDVGDDNHDHLIRPEDRFNIAMDHGPPIVTAAERPSIQSDPAQLAAVRHVTHLPENALNSSQ